MISLNEDNIIDDNYVILEINGTDTCAGRALSFYIYEKYLDDISKFRFDGMWTDCTYKKIKKSRFLCNQDITIQYEERDIHIKYIVHNAEPGELRCNEWGYYTTINLITLRERGGIIILEEFMDFLKEYYEENVIHNRHGLKNEVLVQTWNTYSWESSNTRIKRNLDTVYLPKNIKDNLIERVDSFLQSKTKEKYNICGIPYKLNVLLEGFPGTGKTSLIFALASKYNYNIAIMSFTNKVDDYSFIKALQKISPKTFLILEDIDCLFKERKKHDDIRNMVSFTAILNGLDGVYSKDGLITFMSTNYIENLDSALIRPGRVDIQYNFDYMDKESMRDMFTAFLPNLIDEFDKFYNKIRNKKILASSFQQYLFKYGNIEDLLNNLPELDSTFVSKASMYT
jgi:hypothetical protein